MTTKQTPTPTAANVYAELVARCETLPADKLALLETNLRAAGLPIAADLVRQYGVANCGEVEYSGYLADLQRTEDEVMAEYRAEQKWARPQGPF